ncbi:hypothetical protein QOT17_025214, partial [Balamuthia mandrillaris]
MLEVLLFGVLLVVGGLLVARLTGILPSSQPSKVKGMAVRRKNGVLEKAHLPSSAGRQLRRRGGAPTATSQLYELSAAPQQQQYHQQYDQRGPSSVTKPAAGAASPYYASLSSSVPAMKSFPSEPPSPSVLSPYFSSSWEKVGSVGSSGGTAPFSSPLYHPIKKKKDELEKLTSPIFHQHDEPYRSERYEPLAFSQRSAEFYYDEDEAEEDENEERETTDVINNKNTPRKSLIETLMEDESANNREDYFKSSRSNSPKPTITIKAAENNLPAKSRMDSNRKRRIIEENGLPLESKKKARGTPFQQQPRGQGAKRRISSSKSGSPTSESSTKRTKPLTVGEAGEPETERDREEEEELQHRTPGVKRKAVAASLGSPQRLTPATTPRSLPSDVATTTKRRRERGYEERDREQEREKRPSKYLRDADDDVQRDPEVAATVTKRNRMNVLKQVLLKSSQQRSMFDAASGPSTPITTLKASSSSSSAESATSTPTTSTTTTVTAPQQVKEEQRTPATPEEHEQSKEDYKPSSSETPVALSQRDSFASSPAITGTPKNRLRFSSKR